MNNNNLTHTMYVSSVSLKRVCFSKLYKLYYVFVKAILVVLLHILFVFILANLWTVCNASKLNC